MQISFDSTSHTSPVCHLEASYSMPPQQPIALATKCRATGSNGGGNDSPGVGVPRNVFDASYRFATRAATFRLATPLLSFRLSAPCDAAVIKR